MDRDPVFSGATTRALLKSSNVKILRCPRKSPKANAFVERMNGTLQRECTDHFLFFGKRQLKIGPRKVLRTLKAILTR